MKRGSSGENPSQQLEDSKAKAAKKSKKGASISKEAKDSKDSGPSSSSAKGFKQLKLKTFFCNIFQASKRRPMDDSAARALSQDEGFVPKTEQHGDGGRSLKRSHSRGASGFFEPTPPYSSSASRGSGGADDDQDVVIPNSAAKPTGPKPTEYELKKINRRTAPLRNETNDTINYRKDPKETFDDDPNANDNYLFYTGRIPLKPDRVYLQSVHSKWFGLYQLLEANHNYIQWLFPIGTLGMNYDSQPLQYHEYKNLRNDENFRGLLIKSFELMLDFYGMRLTTKEDGTVKITRTEGYKARYTNLLQRSHNLLRITRILKCLGYFGLSAYQEAWIDFFILEIYGSAQLESLESSVTRFWVHTIRDDRRREATIERLEELIKKDVLGPE